MSIGPSGCGVDLSPPHGRESEHQISNLEISRCNDKVKNGCPWIDEHRAHRFISLKFMLASMMSASIEMVGISTAYQDSRGIVGVPEEHNLSK